MPEVGSHIVEMLLSAASSYQHKQHQSSRPSVQPAMHAIKEIVMLYLWVRSTSENAFYTKYNSWLGSRVVSVLDSGAEGPGFKSQP